MKNKRIKIPKQKVTFFVIEHHEINNLWDGLSIWYHECDGTIFMARNYKENFANGASLQFLWM